MVDELKAHDVYIKDVEYLDEKDKSAKRCKTLDEYYALPLKKCTLSKVPIGRSACHFEAGECALFGEIKLFKFFDRSRQFKLT
jgi:hypothetical protein